MKVEYLSNEELWERIRTLGTQPFSVTFVTGHEHDVVLHEGSDMPRHHIALEGDERSKRELFHEIVEALSDGSTPGGITQELDKVLAEGHGSVLCSVQGGTITFSSFVSDMP